MCYSYITVCTDFNYVPGVLALNKALKRYGADFPLSVVVSDTTEDSVVTEFQRNALKVHRIRPGFKFGDRQQLINRANNCKRWNDTLLKLEVFMLEEYKKLVFLDSDMLIRYNIDNLFDFPDLSFCRSGKFCGRVLGGLFNSGLMVFCPSINYRSIFSLVIERFKQYKEPVSDNEILCEAFGKAFKPNSHQEIPEIYNMLYPDLVKNVLSDRITVSDVKIVHFVGQVKPWNNIKFFLTSADYGFQSDIINEYGELLWGEI